MSPSKTRVLLGVALVGTVIAAWFAPPSETQDVALSPRTQSAATQIASSPSTNVGAIRRESPDKSPEVLRIHVRDQEGADDAADRSLFLSTKWVPAVKHVVEESLPEVPPPVVPLQAPPLPFRVMGRYEEAGQVTVFLQHNDQNLIVRAGETIAEQYKVESLKGSILTLRYLPLDQVQSLEIGSAR